MSSIDHDFEINHGELGLTLELNCSASSEYIIYGGTECLQLNMKIMQLLVQLVLFYV